MRKRTFLLLGICLFSLLFLFSCDLFNFPSGTDKVSVLIFFKTSAVPSDLYKSDGTWAKIELNLLNLKIFGMDRNLDEIYDSSKNYSDPIDSFEVKKGSKDAKVEITVSPKATVSIYDEHLLVNIKSLTFESTKLSLYFERFSADSMATYNVIDLFKNENVWIMINLDEIENLYSSPTGNLSFMVMKDSDLINITGHVNGEKEHFVKFVNGYYKILSTFTQNGDFTMKLPKGNYDVTIEIYELDAENPSTSTVIQPIHDMELQF